MLNQLKIKTMKNQNLNIDVDLTALNKALKDGLIFPNKWTDAAGNEHVSIMLFAKETRNPTDKKTHNITAKASDSFHDAKDASGHTLYFGRATPSKFQPEDNGVTTKPENDNTFEVNY